MSNTSFEEVLARDGRLIYTNVGTSMLPLIRQGQDLLVIEPPRGRLKKYDIALYRRDSGQYVLHRVLKVRERDYVISGDNRWGKETGITDAHILGVMVSRIRSGKELHMSDWRCQLYAHLWCDFFPIRCLFLKGIYVLGRLKR